MSSVSPFAGDDWFSGPEEKSVSIMRLWGVVKEGLRNWTGSFMEGVEGKTDASELGLRSEENEGFLGESKGSYEPVNGIC